MNEDARAEALLAPIGAAMDADIDLAEAALLLASLDRPDLALAPYRAHLAELVADTRATAAKLAPVGALSVAQRAEVLHRVLAERHGYAGDKTSYDDPDNASLLRVIDRRRGLPVSLSILYIHAAEAQGWAVAGLNFPAHFLLRLDSDEARAILDPFHGGRVLGAPDLRALLKRFAGPDAELQPAFYEPVGRREILLRLLNNIKTRALQARDAARARVVLHRMVTIAPTEAALWHQYALVNIQCGNLAAARSAFETCLLHAEDETLRRQARIALERLRQHLH